MAIQVTLYACEVCRTKFDTAEQANECARSNLREKQDKDRSRRFDFLVGEVNWRLTDEFISAFADLVSTHFSR